MSRRVQYRTTAVAALWARVGPGGWVVSRSRQGWSARPGSSRQGQGRPEQRKKEGQRRVLKLAGGVVECGKCNSDGFLEGRCLVRCQH